MAIAHWPLGLYSSVGNKENVQLSQQIRCGGINTSACSIISVVLPIMHSGNVHVFLCVLDAVNHHCVLNVMPRQLDLTCTVRARYFSTRLSWAHAPLSASLSRLVSTGTRVLGTRRV